MPLPRNDYVPQLAVVANARLRGLDAQAPLVDDPNGLAFHPSRDVFRGFALDGGFEPSFSAWVDTLRARGLQALHVLTAVEPADWILQRPPPLQPRLPSFVLVFPDRQAWYDYRLENAPAGNHYIESFVPVEDARRIAVPSVDAAERELLEATRAYVRFLEGKVPHDDASAVFYEKAGREALDLLDFKEPRFLEWLAARREAKLRELRKDYKGALGRPYTKEQRPEVLERAARAARMDDLARTMEEAGLSWRTQRLWLATEGLRPLNMGHERTSQDRLPDHVHHPGYVAVGSRLDHAACDARNAALNASG